MLLMEEAERIAREEHGAHKLSVISGIVCSYKHQNYLFTTYRYVNNIF